MGGGRECKGHASVVAQEAESGGNRVEEGQMEARDVEMGALHGGWATSNRMRENESGEVMRWKGLMRKGRKNQAPLSATSKPGCPGSTYRVVKWPRRLSTILSDDASGME